MIEFLGWTVDMQPCERHGGVGVGMNIYFLKDGEVIIPLWWCSVDDLNDFIYPVAERLRCE